MFRSLDQRAVKGIEFLKIDVLISHRTSVLFTNEFPFQAALSKDWIGEAHTFGTSVGEDQVGFAGILLVSANWRADFRVRI
jgi:hypothetical protein